MNMLEEKREKNLLPPLVVYPSKPLPIISHQDKHSLMLKQIPMREGKCLPLAKQKAKDNLKSISRLNTPK